MSDDKVHYLFYSDLCKDKKESIDMKKQGWIVCICLFCLLLAGCSSDGAKDESSKESSQQQQEQVSGEVGKSEEEKENPYITMVKTGCPSNYPDSPYGEVFEKFFENSSWGYFEAKNQKGKVVDIVEFTGECEFEKADYQAQIQFTVDADNNSFDASYLALDGEAQTMTTLQKLLAKAYEKEGPAVSGEIGVPVQETPATTAPKAAAAPAPKAENNYYILPYSSSYPLTKSDISHLTTSQLRLARNEIYARHGRMFNDKGLQNYFNSQAWYTPIYSSSEFSDSWLSKVEADNIEFIKSFE